MGLFDKIAEEEHRREKMKEAKQERSSEKTKGALIGMVFCIIASILSIRINLGSFAFIYLIGAIACGIFFYTLKSKHKLWNNYDSIINHRGNTALSSIASYVEKDLPSVCKDLQIMIDKGFFLGDDGHHNAYIDHDYSLLVITKDDVPIEDPSEYFKKNVSQKPSSGIKSTSIVDQIRNYLSIIDDEDVKDTLYDLEGSIRRIGTIIKNNPTVRSNRDLIKIKEYYFPQLIALIKKYSESENDEIKNRIKDALKNCSKAFRNIEKELSDADDMTTSINISVLNSTLSREGLLGSDFDIN